MKRGEIWLVCFDPSVGSEIRKTRPALIVSNDLANRNSSKLTVVPLTGTIKKLPIIVIVDPGERNGLTKRSLIRIPDVTTFDKSRFQRRLGELTPEQMAEVEARLRLHLDL